MLRALLICITVVFIVGVPLKYALIPADYEVIANTIFGLAVAGMALFGLWWGLKDVDKRADAFDNLFRLRKR